MCLAPQLGNWFYGHKMCSNICSVDNDEDPHASHAAQPKVSCLALSPEEACLQPLNPFHLIDDEGIVQSWCWILQIF